jgi:molecular chaperone GrpE
MSYHSNPYGRRRVGPGYPSGGAGRPTLEDFQTLATAYQELKAAVERQRADLATVQRELVAKQQEAAEAKRKLAERTQELEIKGEALHRQSTDLKQLEAELVWAKAALQQQDQQSGTGKESAPESGTWRDRYLRLQSDLENMRRRYEQRFATETAEARHSILRDMLPLADHLEMALRHADGLEGEQVQEFLRNIGVTRQAFLDTLKRYGVEPVEAKGQPFDPNLHEAVGQVQDDQVPTGTVAQVLQEGYREGERLLRPARVLISG